ncbi:MAG: AMP-binding protein [Candidatus Sumerlaeia bacterium]|nr:AMP-binding protein [Candidatus Sumerlaeia bacterium]
MALLQRFVQACSTAPPRAVIVDGPQRLPYPDLLRRSVGLGLALRQRDKSPDGHVGIFLPNCWAFVASYFGSLLGAKVPVPLNVLLQPGEIAYILKDARIHTVLTISMFKPMFEQLAGKLPWEVTPVYLDEMPAPPPGITPPPIDVLIGHEAPDKLACLIYTSGTTGNPKGVMLTYGNLEANYEGSSRVLDLGTNQDVVVAQLPLFHSFGMMATMIVPVLDQAPIVMLARFQPQQLLKTLVEEKVTALMLVAPMFGLLCRMLRAKPLDLSALRICVSGGGPLPPTIEQAWRAITGKDILNGYGLTEASPVVSNNAPGANKSGTIGRPLHNVTIEIRDADGRALPAGQEGEICVKAESVMKGYLNLEEDTRKAFTPDGLLKTGDLGFLDEEGYLHITGRAKDLIIFAGENIMPLEIENAILTFPGVAEAAVVGLPDETKGEVPVAAIVALEGAAIDEGKLREHLRTMIADFKVPRQFHMLAELPKNTMNKVLKPKLREMLMAEA